MRKHPTITLKEIDHEIAKEFKTPGPRKCKLDSVELQMIEIFKEKPDRHLSFFNGIIPSLNTFDDDEILEFQMEVLRTITSIKKRKRLLSSQSAAVIRPPHSSHEGNNFN